MSEEFIDKKKRLKLIQAYAQTSYRVYVGRKYIDFRVGELVNSINWCYGRERITSWLFVSAENPYSCRLAIKENNVRTQRLARFLSKSCFKFVAGYGIPDHDNWPVELGFFLLNANFTNAVSIGRRFEQNALVTKRPLEPPRLMWLK